MKPTNGPSNQAPSPAPSPAPHAAPLSNGLHLTTISYDGRFWEVYLEFQDDPRSPSSYRALLCFSPSTGPEGETALRTTTILIEDSHEGVVSKARDFEDFQLQSLLRSLLPDPE